MSMFVEPADSEYEIFPEEEFDNVAREHNWSKRVSIEKINNASFRRVFYAAPGEHWRINAMLLVQELYASLMPGRRPDLERVIGALLGYDREDTENYLKWLATK